MPRIEGLKAVQRALEKTNGRFFESSNAVAGESVITGYTAGYALWVHENLQPAPGATKRARKEGRQGKYLEQPAREMQDELGNIVASAATRGAKLQQALYLAALRLQGESQRIVPWDIGNLRASAFTRKE